MNIGIKIVNYLVIMMIKIFREHVSLHVDFNFMFVNS